MVIFPCDDEVLLGDGLNSSANPIYKNGFKLSTWNTLIQNRIDISTSYLSADGILCATIDDFQQKDLHSIIEQSLGVNSILGTVVIRNNPSGRPIPSGFAVAHEYAIFARINSSVTINKLERTELQNQRYKETDNTGRFMWELLRKRGSNSRRDDARRSYFPFYVGNNSIRLPTLKWEEENSEWIATEKPLADEKIVYPIDENGVERNWRWGLDTAINNVNSLKVERKGGIIVVYYKFRQPEGSTPLTNWIDSRYSATEHGTGLVKHFFKKYQPFSYPKSLYAVEDSISIAGMRDGSFNICLDYFAGSGTTGHAVIALNRADQGHRKYILVEQGDYFDTVLKPRIQKVVYSAEWKDGKATAPQTGISHAFKVLKIESYEDTLNNLQLRRTPKQQELLDTLPKSAQEEYLLRYLLDIESRGSLLSVEHFNKPFDCKLKVAVDSAGAYEERTIDLVETFNYLIGLRVKHIDMQQGKGFVLVTGLLPTGEKTLVLWRDLELVDYDTLNRLCDKLAINPRDSEYDIVYINGDHNIPAVFTTTEAEGSITKTLKLRQIEPEFLSRMFSVERVS
ncbi:site-specific DNA-methyltransferase [Chlorobium phaeovibrioides]|uniref:Site-specific DNA-methyltransferase n=1 Tax=Chlorobium phaeovibrioides TaxID=1094 RepID=A0A5M8IDQ6_CHLPH|nr:DNA methyltransferase [Chlorobium phaeovibrioides]KAA6232515.1 site-specific DNA-methyltransferase [Chlorobium phaeovibrioides]